MDDLACMQFGGWRADDPAFLRLWEVFHAWAVAAEHVEEVHDAGGWALEGKVICIPGLEDRWVQSPEGFGKWHEANAIEDHAPHASLHDALSAKKYCWFSTGWSTKDQAALMVVEVVGELRACMTLKVRENGL